jgi:hypothetical protein
MKSIDIISPDNKILKMDDIVYIARHLEKLKVKNPMPSPVFTDRGTIFYEEDLPDSAKSYLESLENEEGWKFELKE